MKWLLIILLLCECVLVTTAQQNSYDSYKAILKKFPAGTGPNLYDSLYQLSLPELTLPEHLKSASLPAVADNSSQPYLRPVFSQIGASCGQASAIGYNFTYEMDHARGLPANISTNQYPTHFTYNFENTGWEYFGVSYFHSFEILKKCGNMNVKDYGSFTDNGSRWITGYGLYYNGMLNRIDDIYSIKTNSQKGILALKNWVYNHMGESQAGGVASFYAGYSLTQLPAGTPQQGRFVATSFTAPAVHAMTIVGYNDSIRYDYNNDGLYTNNLDTNNDGIVDVKDWEIGGFRFVNSYGSDWPNDSDSGFCYMMYRTLAEDYGKGGIWNNAVHVVKVKPDYTPLLTMKIRIKDTQRSSIRVRAGISADPASLVPEHILDFPIFNFQGGNFPMQGPGNEDTLRTIEFGLDITPLLSYVQKGRDTGFFLTVDENDPYSQANGRIEYLAVLDYSTSPPHTFACQQTPVDIANNDVTYAKVIVKPDIDNVRINDSEPVPFVAGQAYTTQLSAAGGQMPYNWSLNYAYTKINSNKPMPAFSGTKLSAQSPSDSIVAVALGFPFPLYGRNYDTVFVNINNGYLQFTTDIIPWPYLSEENLLLRSFRLIAPLTNQNLNVYNSNEGAWVQAEPGTTTFCWKLSKKLGETYFPCEFRAKLSADGTITLNHGNIQLAAYELFHSGISDGDKQNYDLSVYHTDYEANQYTQSEYIPATVPGNLSISKTGLVECLPADGKLTYTIPVKVTDYRNVSNEKVLLLSSGILAEIKLHSGNDSIPDRGENARADLLLTNLTNSMYTDIMAVLKISDEFIVQQDTAESAIALGPHARIIVPDAFQFSTSTASPDGHAFLMNLSISSGLLKWNRSIATQISSPLLKTVELCSKKPFQELLRPGETNWLQYKATNIGHSTAKDVDVRILLPDTHIKLLSADLQFIGMIVPGQKSSIEFEIKASDSIALGSCYPVVITLSAENHVQLIDTIYIRIGKAPALVIDLDKNRASAPAIWQQIKDLGYLSDYKTVLTNNMDEYQSLFINLGKNSDRHVLSYSEGIVLADYLDQGGNIYIESRTLWRDDLLTVLQPRFNIEAINKLHVYDTLAGTPGSFTEGMAYKPSSVFAGFFYMQPLWQAFSLFEGDGYPCSVANDAGTYKTIGSLFEFAAMLGTNPESSRPKLMQKYLDFFGIKRDMIGINEAFSKTEMLEVYPNPAIDKVCLTFTMNESGAVKISIVDLNGNTVILLHDNYRIMNSRFSFEWDLCNSFGNKVAPGLYICRVISLNEVKTGKIVVN